MKKEELNKLAAAIACELIGCDGDCDNCNKADVDLSGISKEDLEKELARRANK